MPIPENWKSVFYRPKNITEVLIDWKPERFIEMLQVPPEDPMLLITGACYDLKRNGMSEKADLLMATAVLAWPLLPWSKAIWWIDTAVKIVTDAQAKTKDDEWRQLFEIIESNLQPFLISFLLAVRRKKQTFPQSN